VSARLNRELLERILHDSESTHLDFKSQQYPFYAPATDYQKSELLKDILAMANAETRDDRYILIGVEEVKGGRGIIHGVTSFLNDNDIQEFVNQKVQRPVALLCETVECDKKRLQVISIPVQDRGVFLKQDFKDSKTDKVFLRKSVVYYRLGSSTAEASPDDIMRWAAESVTSKLRPLITFGFAVPQSKEGLWGAGQEPMNLGEHAVWQLKKYKKDLRGQNIRIRRDSDPAKDLEQVDQLIGVFNMLNAAAQIGFCAKNIGQVACKNLVVTITIPKNDSAVCVRSSKMLRPVLKARKGFEPQASYTGFSGKDLELEERPSQYLIRWNSDMVFPGQTIFSKEFLFFSDLSQPKLVFRVEALAENLPQPVSQMLTCEFRIETLEDALPNFSDMVSKLKTFDEARNYSNF
jgi:hypothetical protein